MSDRIELSSSFTHLVDKCRQAAASYAVEHTFKKCSRHCSGVEGNFKRGGDNFNIFFKCIFFGRTNVKLIVKQERFYGGPGACSTGKCLQIYML